MNEQIININLFKPYPKQRVIVQSIIDTDVKVHSILSGRQVGKTLLSENLCCYYFFNAKVKEEIGFIMPTFTQCKKVYNSILNKLQPLLNEKKFNKLLTINKTNLTIRNNLNNSTIKFFSAEQKDSIRGNTFDYLFVDEADFINNDVWNSIIKPTTFVKCKKIIATSTPKRKGSWFESQTLLSGENPEMYKSYYLTTLDNPYISANEIEMYRKTMPDTIFQQEIMGKYVEGASVVFKYDKSTMFIDFDYKQLVNKLVYIGIDFGNENDYTVVTVWDEKNTLIDILRIRQHNDGYEGIVKLINDEILKKYKNHIGYIESNSMGSSIYDFNKKVFANFELFNTNKSSKKEIIEDFIYLINNNLIKIASRLSAVIEPFFSELETFEYEYNVNTRSITYAARQGFHDDIVMSSSIGLNALKKLRNRSLFSF